MSGKPKTNILLENYSNHTIDTIALPRFEDVELTPLEPSYFKVIRLNIALIFVILTIGTGAAFYFVEELHNYWLPITAAYIVIVILSILFSSISFRNRGFAFRNHDVIYRSGVISLNTTIIPYNRVQHVALHEGFISRYFGLASVEIFTAGGDQSDIRISGIEKEHAEKIKQLLMGKIINETADGE